MKQMAHKIKRRQFPRTDKKKSMATRVRPRVILQNNRTHLASDKCEEQANEAALRILRGEQEVSRTLTPAPTATMRVNASRGEPLNLSLREQLENGFNADFSKVRIHRDAPAHASAKQQQAKAYTAGAHIYFAQGMYQPGSLTGQELLAHELTHTLQQTGRRSTDGRMKVTEVSGSGPVQLEPDDLVDELTEANVFDAPSYTWTRVKQVYSGVAGVSVHIQMIESAAPQTPNAGPPDIDSIRESLDNLGSATPAEVRGLYVDALKIFGTVEDAAAALVANPDVPTAFRSRELYVAVHEAGVDWLPRYVRAHSFLSTYYPDRLVDGYRTYFFMYTSRDEVPVDIHLDYLAPDADRSAARLFRDEIWSRISATSSRPIRNELEMAALFAMRTLDDDRRRWLPATLRVMREAHPDRSWQSWVSDTAERFTEPMGENRQLGTDKTEVVALFEEIYPSIQEAATRAVAYWQRITVLTDAIMNGTTFEQFSIEEVAAFGSRLETNSVTQSLPTMLTDLANDLFARNNDELPSAGDFARRVTLARTRIQDELRRIGLRIADAARRRRETSSSCLVLGLAVGVLTSIDNQLLRYDPTLDATLAIEGRSDMRVATRIWVAKTLRDIGSRLGLDSIVQTSNSVFLEGVQFAVLDRRADKQDHRNDNYNQMRNDLGRISGWEHAGITPWHLWTYSEIGYWNAIRDTLMYTTVVMGNEDTPIPIDTLVSEAQAIGRRSLPRRYTLEPVAYADPSMAARAGPRVLSWSSLLSNRFEYQSVLNEVQDGEVILAPNEPPSGSVIPLWIFPRADALAGRFSRLPGMSEAVRAHFEATHPGEAVPTPDDWLNWLNALGEMAQQMSEEDRAGLQRVVSHTVQEDYDAAARQATTEIRRIYFARFVRMLDNYDRSGHDRWNIPDVLLRDIETFARNVRPNRDKALQVAALVLEVAPQLARAFGVVASLIDVPVIQRHAIADPLLTLVWGARRIYRAAVREREARQASDTPFEEPPLFAISSLGYSGATVNEGHLSRLQRELTEYAVSEQRRNGLSADPGRGLSSVRLLEEGWTIIQLGMRTEWIPVDTPFDLYGIRYEIKEINARFFFHKGFGARETLGIEWGSGRRPGDALLLDESGETLPISGRVLVVYERTPDHGQGTTDRIEVRDNDMVALRELTSTIESWFDFEYLAGAGVVISTIAEAELTAFETIFPQVSVATFAATVFQAAGSPEITELLDAIREQGFGAFDEIFEALTAVVDFDELGNALLFEEDFRSSTRSNPRLQPRSSAGMSRARARGGVWGRLGQVLASIFRIGLRILDALKRLAKRVQVPVREVQLFVMRKPVMLMMLDFIFRAWEILSSLELDDLEELLEGLQEGNWRTRLQTELREGLQELVTRSQEIFDTLRHLEMPEQLIAKELIIDAIMDLVVDLLRGRYRVGAITLRGLLRTVGLWNRITTEIGNQLLVGGLDPNEHYRNELRARINPWFTQVRDQFVEQLESRFEEIPFVSGLVATPGTPIDIGSAMSGFGFDLLPSTTPLPANGLDVPISPTFGEGAPLPPLVRSRAELAFGHDFGHVRMHTGSEGDGITSKLHALGATAGSHVWMRSSLPPTALASQPVLFHELAHVIQQTGSRPLYRDHDTMPATRSTTQGYNFDPAREASAHHAAVVAGSRGVATSPVDVGGRSVGVQPAFTAEFLRTFIRHLGERQDLVEVREEHARAGDVRLDADTNTIVQSVTAGLRTIMTAPSTRFQNPFNNVRAELVALIQDRWNEIADAIPRIASLAVFPVRPAGVTRDPSRQDPPRVPWLNPDAFKMEIQRELYAVTGLAMIFEFRTEDGSGPLARQRVIDTASPLRSVSFVHLDLPLLDAMGSDSFSETLWDALITNTYGNNGTLAAGELLAFKGAAKLVLGRTTSRYGLYHRTRFALSRGKAIVVRNQRERIDTLIAGAWPTPQQYVNTDPTAVPADVSPIGLRLETYATKASVTDRDAHHTVQYLLFEYFSNVKRLKPFPLLGQSPGNLEVPGVVPAGTTQVRAMEDGAGAQIDIGTFYPGRGGAMPTISISKNTHLSGVHFRSELPDDLSSPRSSQGATVHNVFTSEVSDHYWSVLNDAQQLAELQARQQANQLDDDIRTDTTQGRPVTVRRVSRAIYRASQETYRQMWEDMRVKLEARLGINEVDYYNQVAVRKGIADRIDRATMTATFQEVVDRTETVIGGAFNV